MSHWAIGPRDPWHVFPGVLVRQSRGIDVEEVRQVGLDGLRVHDLRHTAVTLAAATGATTKELMERMGHTSPGVALRYQHVMADRQAALDDLARNVANTAQAEPGGHDRGPRGGGARSGCALSWADGGAGDGNRTRVTSLEG